MYMIILTRTVKSAVYTGLAVLGLSYISTLSTPAVGTKLAALTHAGIFHYTKCALASIQHLSAVRGDVNCVRLIRFLCLL